MVDDDDESACILVHTLKVLELDVIGKWVKEEENEDDFD